MKKTFKSLTLYTVLACVLNTLPIHTGSATFAGQTNVGRISGTISDMAGAFI